MARISTANDTSMFTIKKWLGLNENPDGDTHLKLGEAAEMRNWRITQDNHLQLRPGTKTILSFDGAAVRGLWTGLVKGAERTVCAAGGKLYALDLQANTKTEIGTLTDDETSFFGFSDKLYILNGHEYMVWDGESAAAAVEGYIPLVATATPPTNNVSEFGGKLLDPVNKLTGKKRQLFSPDGEGKTFMVIESEIASIDKVIFNGVELTTADYVVDLEYGGITFSAADPPDAGTNTLEIYWTKGDGDRSAVEKMHFAEMYNGYTDNRVFLYGDGSNKALYSGLDENGKPTAEYFPDLNVLDAGDANTPITALIRHYSKLLIFKSNSAYSAQYSSITLSDGTVTAGFYTTPVNRDIGNAAPGQVRLVGNYPRTMHGDGVYEWRNASNGMTYDERQAKRISGRINATLASFDLSKVYTFDNELKQDFYICYDGRAVIHNYEADAWFVYEDFPVSAMTVSDGELYVATATGEVKHVSREYMNDDGAAINAYWRSGSIAFDREWRRKFSAMIWVCIKPENAARVTVTAMSDRKSGHAMRVVASSLAAFDPANFRHFSFNTNRRAQVKRVKLKVKKFALYQLIFESNNTDSRATILSTDFAVTYTGNVK